MGNGSEDGKKTLVFQVRVGTDVMRESGQISGRRHTQESG